MELEARLRRHVQTLADDIGERNAWNPEALAAAIEYIRKEFRAAGYEPAIQTYPVPELRRAPAFTGQNISATVPGRYSQAPVLVVGAHYDTEWNTPGADDNASGVAALLELAARLKPHAGGAELRFIAFGTEEQGFGSDHMGSFHCARALKEEGREVLGMLSLEMLGFYSDEPGSQKYPPLLSLFYPDRANYISVVSNLRSRGFLKRVRESFQPPGGLRVITAALPSIFSQITLSDHYCFWRQGFPAAMVTDTAFLRNEHYHQPTDTPDRLDYARLADTVLGLERTIVGLSRSG